MGLAKGQRGENLHAESPRIRFNSGIELDGDAVPCSLLTAFISIVV